MSLISLLLSLLLALSDQTPGSADLLKQADAAYAEKSFSRAHALYEQAAKGAVTAEERRWIELRLADTDWRSDAASPSPDPAVRDAARAALEELIRKAGNEHDRIWAEAEEALGDYYLLHPYLRNSSAAQQYYTQALDWWAGSRELELARKRYLAIVWRMVTSPYDANAENPYGAPREVLLNALQIATTAEDRAHAHFLIAEQLLAEGQPASVERAFDHLEAVIREGKATRWYDDALFTYASRLSSPGAVVVLSDNQPSYRPDYDRALELYRRLLAEFKPGETRFYKQAENAIEQILAPSVTLTVGQNFLPDSEQEVSLGARNVGKIELSIVPVDVTRDRLWERDGRYGEKIDLASRTAVRRWTVDLGDTGDHAPRYQFARIAPKLEAGAYIVEAHGGGRDARALLLVTDAHVLIHEMGARMDVFVSNVLTGEPIGGARVRAWITTRDNKTTSVDAETNAEGIARLSATTAGGQVTITAAKGSRQAYHQTYFYDRDQLELAQWAIYAFTDRPAYRPGETVKWKMTARTRQHDEWQTPAGATLDYDIVDPRGEKVTTGRATLNSFGSFWSELALTPSMTLGAYSINFRRGDDSIGSAQLFRLEEYKLPEFRVSVTTPDGKQYRTGDSIEAVIEASYYFGGPVANATVEVEVYERPFHRYWFPWRTYGWYWDPPQDDGDGTLSKRETLHTDAEGRATIHIDTPRDRGDLVYRIEAKVTDASRREVVGEGEVKVTAHRYSVMATPEHYLHRAGDKVSIDFKTLDANDKPLSVTGTVTVVRRAATAAARPPFQYDEQTVSTTKVTTDKDGEARFTFTPDREGYYAIRWSSEDRAPGASPRASDLVTTETAVWVTRSASTEIGYRSSDIELIIDKEAFRAGERAPVLVVTPASGRWVVLTTSASDIIETQVVHLDGTVKLIQIPIDQRHVPNFFITASSVFDRTISTQTRSVVVPPVEHFLDVDVKLDREQYEPREKGTVTITTRDVDGKPVQTEVALAVSDESVTAIQEDLAGDPRQFFFGTRRDQTIQVSGSLQSQQYVRLVERDGRLLDDRYAAEQDKRQRDEEGQRRDGVVGGVVGGVMGGVATERAMAMPPPPPAPAPVAAQAMDAMAKSAVAENITVTASAANASTVTVRSDFRSTAFWQPDIVTDANGKATITVDYPEALTTWRATARAASKSAQFGMGTSTARTNMPLIVRLQAPRFFVAGDRATVSAVINNNSDAAMRVAPSIEVEGLTLADPKAAEVEVPAHGEARADWTVVADRSGSAKIRVAARGATRADAMERTFTVYEHGIDKLVARSGRMRADETIVRLDLPAQRRATELVVRLQPDLAVAMLDALPYLVDFPYGCTEQTMSRFLPAAVVKKTLGAYGREVPVPKNLDAVTAASMARLYDFQHDDGGWGWWKEGDSDAFMTGYVIWGFAVARDAGLRVRAEAIDRAADWLDKKLVELDPHRQAWALHALAAWRHGAGATTLEKKVLGEVFTNRERLSAYSRALLALAANDFGDIERAKVLVRNLEDGVRIDSAPDQSVLVRGGSSTAETMGTAHWGATGFWWQWFEGPIETTAFALQAIVRIDPTNKLIEPATNWLVKNRSGARWSNTRDTAIAILALLDRRASDPPAPAPYELLVNGKSIAKGTIDPLRSAKIAVDPTLVKEANEITIRSPKLLYFAAEARFVSLEEPVKAAGNELFVRRDYYRLVPHPTLLKGVEFEEVPLRDGETIASGDRVQVVITIETKNDYEYLLFEDLKPAGFEAVELQSGEPLYAKERRTSRSEFIYQELRDRNVALFAQQLPQGVWEIRYPLRAEVPGRFHALPVLGHAMYVPEIRANGDEVRVTVE